MSLNGAVIEPPQASDAVSTGVTPLCRTPDVSGAPMITLQKISRRNIHAVLALDVAEDQRGVYPRSNAYSIAEGHYPLDSDPVWMRAICDGKDPVGFMMTSEVPDRGEYFLWRLMIDLHHQGRGHGLQAMNLLIERIRRNGNPRILLTSHLKANASAGRFYQKLGFEYTGEDLGGGDLGMSLRFDP